MTNILLLDALSGVFLIAAVVLSIIVAFDMKARPQSMKIMSWVWFLTILWSSLLGFIAYFIFGREKMPENKPVKSPGNSDKMHSEAGVIEDDETDMAEMTSLNSSSKDSMKMSMSGMDMAGMKPEDHGAKMHGMKMPMDGMDMSKMQSEKDESSKTMNMSMSMKGMSMVKRPKWQSIALSAMHCGAGCTLADIIGESYSGIHPVAIGGSFLIGSWVIDYILALIIGVYFQYIAIREMENIQSGKAIIKAIKADFLSLTAWQIGMYGWMAIAVFVIFKDQPLLKTSTDFWFMMQIAMLCGFLTAYPMNALLIKFGIKKGM